MRFDGGQSLRDERGQTLVFVALSLGVLIAATALVVDVGNWFQAKRHAQSVADAAALAAAPQLLDNPGAVPGLVSANADQNWSGAQITQSQGARSVQVTAEPPAGSDLSPFGHFPISISASATAAIQIPAELDAIAPIVVVCSACSPGLPWDANSWYGGPNGTPGPPIPVSYTAGGNPANNTLAPIQLPGVSTSNFSRYVSCDATTPNSSSCNQTSATAGNYEQGLCLRSRRRGCRDANSFESALSAAADGTTHLVAIADGYCGDCAGTSGYHVVGWGAGTFSSPAVSGPTVTMSISFRSLLVDGKWLQPGSPGNDFDFGVRAIALTG